MAHKVNRADILFSILRQFDTLPDSMPAQEGDGMLMVSDVIRPVVDISRPSKVPYADWRAGTLAGNGDLIPAKTGKRIVLVFAQVNVYNLVTDTGTAASVRLTIGGNLIYFLTLQSPASTVFNNHAEFSGELVCDENTPVEANFVGAWGAAGARAMGYYVRA